MKVNNILFSAIFGASLVNLSATTPAYSWQPVDDLTKMTNTVTPPPVQTFDSDGKPISTGQNQVNKTAPNPDLYEVQKRNTDVADKLSNKSPEYKEGFAGAQKSLSESRSKSSKSSKSSRSSRSTGTNPAGWERKYSETYGGQTIYPHGRDPNENNRNAEIWNRDHMR